MRKRSGAMKHGTPNRPISIRYLSTSHASLEEAMTSSKCFPLAGILLLSASVFLQGCGSSTPDTGSMGGSSQSMGGSLSGSGGSSGSPSGSGGSVTGMGGSTTGAGGSVTGAGGTSSGNGGSAMKTGGTSAGNGGSSAGTGGTAGGSSGASGSGACPDRTAATLAIHLILDVTWPATLGASGGTGKFHLWNLAKPSTSGTTLSGTIQPCGNIVPEATLSALVGGGKIQIVVPNAFWDTQAPKFQLTGTQSGWTSNSTVVLNNDPALVGLTMTDPNAAWPASYTSITADDVDKDGKAGLTAMPQSGSGYVNPPLSILGAAGSKADQVYLATRTEVNLDGAFTSCIDQSGKATTKFLDQHVVGCHVEGGAECTAAEAKFLDDNRTAFTVTGGTYVAKIVADTATCSDVRTALPAN
jgi:hypothetical protein